MDMPVPRVTVNVLLAKAAELLIEEGDENVHTGVAGQVKLVNELTDMR